MAIVKIAGTYTAPARQIKTSWRERLALIVGGGLVALLVLEGCARLVSRWCCLEKVLMLTDNTEIRGRFMSDATFGYVLTPNFRDSTGNFSHNSYGFRGPEFPLAKPPGGLRVVLLGASTVYGIFVKDSETAAAQLQQRLRDWLPTRPVEVLNAGVPGWTSLQTARNLERRVLPLDPDIVIIMDGRNEVFPQLFNNYREDYTHYLIPGFNVRNSNSWHKKLFRVSHLFMALATAGSGHMGFSLREEHPAYGSVNVANTPSAEELRKNAEDLRRIESYRRHLQQAIRAIQAQDAMAILVTMPFLSAKYASGILRRDESTLPTIAMEVARNNAIVRAVAQDSGVAIADAALLTSRPALFVDDSHFTSDGEEALADLFLETIKPLLSRAHRIEPHQGSAYVLVPYSTKDRQLGSNPPEATGWAPATRPTRPRLHETSKPNRKTFTE